MTIEIRCPACGCNDVHTLKKNTLWGVPGLACVCNYCSRRFQVEIDEGSIAECEYSVKFEPMLCPSCGSKKNRVTSTRHKKGDPTIRYHRCDDCKKTFKSVEDA